ncbi:MAG: hypothetical protein ACOCVL_04145 [Candidatus Sumerlaeota bacterium]
MEVDIKLVIAVVVQLATAAWGAYKAFKEKRYKGAWVMSEQTLRVLVTAIEVLPESEKTRELKRTIQAMADAVGVESEKLAYVVREIENLLKSHNVGKDEVDIERALRAAKAVEQARKAREKKSTKNSAALAGASLILIVLLCLGCSSSSRLTYESVWPGEEPDQVDVAVEWPQGVKAEEVYTLTVDGRALSVAPYEKPENPAEPE